MNAQPQLLHLPLNPRDVVYTPDDVARDVVAFFKPSGRILEPSKGDGAFMKYLPPDTEWCEISEGRDFFANHEHYDWIVGNPPYSIFSDWLRHSFKIADNVVYLIPLNKIVNVYGMMLEIQEYGGIPAVYVVGNGFLMGMNNFSYAMGAAHFQKGYKGGTYTVFRK